MPVRTLTDKRDFPWQRPGQKGKVPARLPSGPWLPGNEGESITFRPCETTTDPAAPLLASNPLRAPAATRHRSALGRQREGVIDATTNGREDKTARSLLIGPSRAHRAGLSVTPFFLGEAAGIARSANGPNGPNSPNGPNGPNGRGGHRQHCHGAPGSTTLPLQAPYPCRNACVST